jgi:hypothetical protein
LRIGAAAAIGVPVERSRIRAGAVVDEGARALFTDAMSAAVTNIAAPPATRPPPNPLAEICSLSAGVSQRSDCSSVAGNVVLSLRLLKRKLSRSSSP